jgi:hypothetical protein
MVGCNDLSVLQRVCSVLLKRCRSSRLRIAALRAWTSRAVSTSASVRSGILLSAVCTSVHCTLDSTPPSPRPPRNLVGALVARRLHVPQAHGRFVFGCASQARHVRPAAACRGDQCCTPFLGRCNAATSDDLRQVPGAAGPLKLKCWIKGSDVYGGEFLHSCVPHSHSCNVPACPDRRSWIGCAL